MQKAHPDAAGVTNYAPSCLAMSLAALLGVVTGVAAALVVSSIHAACDYGFGGGWTLIVQLPLMSVLGAVVGFAVFSLAYRVTCRVSSCSPTTVRIVAWTAAACALALLVVVDVEVAGTLENYYGSGTYGPGPDYC